MNGVPFEVSFGLSATQRFAWVVAIGELKGGRFDWARMEWGA